MSLTEAKRFFDGYADCFTRGDAEALAGYWTLPSFISGANGRSGAFLEREFFIANTRRLCEFYSEQGAVRAEKVILDVQSVYEDVTLVRTGDRLTDADGLTVATWEHVYLLRRKRSGWKVFMAVADGELAAWDARGTPLGSRSVQ